MRHIIALALLLMHYFHGLAQEKCTLSLSGIVLDAHNGESLSNVAVYIKNTGRFYITDTTGKFYFDGLCEGAHSLLFRHFDCEPREKGIYLKKSQYITFYLEHHENRLHEIVVTDKSFEAQPLQSIQKITSSAISRQFGKTLSQMLADVGGFAEVRTGAQIGKPMLQGLTGQRIVILNHGVKLEAQHWGNEHGPEVDASLAQHIQVVKGASSVRYGADAIGGVISVVPFQFNLIDTAKGAVAVSYFANGRKWALQGFRQGIINPKKTIKYHIGFKAAHGGYYRTPAYYLNNTSIREYTPSVAISFVHRKWTFEQFYNCIDASIGLFTGTHIGNLTDFLNAIRRSHPIDTVGFSYRLGNPRQSIRHHLSKTSITYQQDEQTRWDFQYSAQLNRRKEFDRFGSRIDSIAAKNIPALDFELRTLRFEMIWQKQTDSYGLVLGSDGILQMNEYRGFYLIPNFFQGGGGLFSVMRVPFKRGRFEAGLRYDYRGFIYKKLEEGQIISPRRDFQNFSATLSVAYKLCPEWDILFHSATGWRPPTPNELFSDGVHHGAARYERGDRHMGAERIWNNMLTLHYAHKALHVNADIYTSYFNGFINLQPGDQPVVTIRGTFPGYVFKQSDAWQTGLDLAIQVPVTGDLNAEAMVSALRIKNLRSDSAFALIPPNRAHFKLDYHLPHGKLFSENHVQLGLVLVDKQRKAAPDFVEPPPAYWLTTLAFQSELSVGTHPLLLQCEILNLFNRRYRDYLDNWRYYSDAQGLDMQFKVQYLF